MKDYSLITLHVYTIFTLVNRMVIQDVAIPQMDLLLQKSLHYKNPAFTRKQF